MQNAALGQASSCARRKFCGGTLRHLGGRPVRPAPTRKVFPRVLKRKQRQQLQLLRAHSHVFPAGRPRNATSMMASASSGHVPNS